MKISKRPMIMPIIPSHRTVVDSEAKLLATEPTPGPRFANVAITAPRADSMSMPVISMAKNRTRKVNIQAAKKAQTALITPGSSGRPPSRTTNTAWGWTRRRTSLIP